MGLFARPVPDRLLGRSCASRCASSAGTSASRAFFRFEPTFRLGISQISVKGDDTSVQPACHEEVAWRLPLPLRRRSPSEMVTSR